MLEAAWLLFIVASLAVIAGATLLGPGLRLALERRD
jgi:hypothetical protein